MNERNCLLLDAYGTKTPCSDDCLACGWQADEHARRVARIKAGEMSENDFGKLRIIVPHVERDNNTHVEYEYKGKFYTLAELERLHGVKRNTIHYRITKLGWTVKRAVETSTGRSKA